MCLQASVWLQRNTAISSNGCYWRKGPSIYIHPVKPSTVRVGDWTGGAGEFSAPKVWLVHWYLSSFSNLTLVCRTTCLHLWAHEHWTLSSLAPDIGASSSPSLHSVLTACLTERELAHFQADWKLVRSSRPWQFCGLNHLNVNQVPAFPKYASFLLALPLKGMWQTLQPRLLQSKLQSELIHKLEKLKQLSVLKAHYAFAHCW